LLEISVLLVSVEDSEGAQLAQACKKVVFSPLNFMEGEVNLHKADYIFKPMINANFNACIAICL